MKTDTSDKSHFKKITKVNSYFKWVIFLILTYALINVKHANGKLTKYSIYILKLNILIYLHIIKTY